MALPNKPLGELPATLDPAIVELDTDILIVGGGMAACGTRGSCLTVGSLGIPLGGVVLL